MHFQTSNSAGATVAVEVPTRTEKMLAAQQRGCYSKHPLSEQNSSAQKSMHVNDKICQLHLQLTSFKSSNAPLNKKLTDQPILPTSWRDLPKPATSLAVLPNHPCPAMRSVTSRHPLLKTSSEPIRHPEG